MNPQLVLRMPGGATRVWPLTHDPMSLGRGALCSLRVNDSSVSRRHCEVWMERGEAFVRDLGSSNETLVNGEPVSDTRRLRPGDLLAIGDTCFEIREDITPPLGDDPTTTFSAIIPDHFEAARDDGFSQPGPGTVRDLFQLYTLSKRLAAVETLEELADHLWQFLSEVLSIDAYSLGIVVASGSPIALAPQFYFPDTFRCELDNQALQQLVDRQMPEASRNGTLQGYHIPVLHTDELVAVVSVFRDRSFAPIDTTEIQLIRAATELVAPHIRSVERAMQHARDERRLRHMAGVPQGLIGDSLPMKQIRELIARIAASQINVLILGETGTGKELAARSIHEQSPRAHGPFVAVNCAGLKDELFESLMFGHEPGAFTGASSRHHGYLEEASGGTLFLDEIGELSPSNQARLLRAVESGMLRRVGGSSDISMDVRYVSATNRAFLGAEAERFREDLYFRLCGALVQMPPLRDRPEDIRPLAEHFLGHDPKGGGHTNRLDQSAWDLLAAHPWPGNVRELRQVMEHLSLFHEKNTLEAEDLLPARRPRPQDPEPQEPGFPPTAPLEDIERHHIDRAVRHHQGNLSAAAKSLGINRITLYRRLKRYEGDDSNG